MSDLLRPLSFEKLMALLLEERSADGTIFGVKDIYKAGRSRLPIFGLRIENPVGPRRRPRYSDGAGHNRRLRCRSTLF